MAEESSDDFAFSLADLPYAPLGDKARSPSPSGSAPLSMLHSVARGADLPRLPANPATLALWWLTPRITEAGAATLDFVGNFEDMRDANTIGADKYFHCKANCQAARRGRYGEATARALSDIREIYGEYVKGDPASDVQADQAANRFGRASSKRSPAGCDMVCSSLRPPGLSLRY